MFNVIVFGVFSSVLLSLMYFTRYPFHFLNIKSFVDFAEATLAKESNKFISVFE